LIARGNVQDSNETSDLNGYEDHPVFTPDGAPEPPLSSAELRQVRLMLAQPAAPANLARPDEISLAADSRASQADLAERIYRARRARDRLFSDAGFADPAWDLLLDIFVRSRRSERISVSSACLGASVPEATALRYLKLLVERTYVEREDTPATSAVPSCGCLPPVLRSCRNGWVA
jgi:hypothetical protein